MIVKICRCGQRIATRWGRSCPPCEKKLVKAGRKICGLCGVSKKLEKFGRNAKRSDGKTTYCLVCYRKTSATSQRGEIPERKCVTCGEDFTEAWKQRCKTCRESDNDSQAMFEGVTKEQMVWLRSEKWCQ